MASRKKNIPTVCLLMILPVTNPPLTTYLTAKGDDHADDRAMNDAFEVAPITGSLPFTYQWVWLRAQGVLFVYCRKCYHNPKGWNCFWARCVWQTDKCITFEFWPRYDIVKNLKNLFCKDEVVRIGAIRHLQCFPFCSLLVCCMLKLTNFTYSISTCGWLAFPMYTWWNLAGITYQSLSLTHSLSSLLCVCPVQLSLLL